MIIGGSKKKVIDNIRRCVEVGELNRKVEEDDPVLTAAELAELRKKFYKGRDGLKHRILRDTTYCKVDKVARDVIEMTEVVGVKKLQDLKGGVIVTCNHFNPLDSLAIRKMVKNWRGQSEEVQIVIQESNLALPGELGTLMNNLDTLPLPCSVHDIASEFRPRLADLLRKSKVVLIYPEEEMWFYYRKPRPCKSGAYRFAAENRVPVVSCFTELVEMAADDNEEFKVVKMVLHVLGVIRPNERLSVRGAAKEMCERDYKLKVEAYKMIYGRKLEYTFEKDDIAGWKGCSRCDDVEL